MQKLYEKILLNEQDEQDIFDRKPPVTIVKTLETAVFDDDELYDETVRSSGKIEIECEGIHYKVTIPLVGYAEYEETYHYAGTYWDPPESDGVYLFDESSIELDDRDPWEIEAMDGSQIPDDVYEYIDAWALPEIDSQDLVDAVLGEVPSVFGDSSAKAAYQAKIDRENDYFDRRKDESFYD